MSLTITIAITGRPARSWTVSDGLVDSINAYRNTLRDVAVVSGAPVNSLRHSSIEAFVATLLNDNILRPAIAAFPPVDVSAQVSSKTAADNALSAALSALVPVVP